MVKYVSNINSGGFSKIVLEDTTVGKYIFVYETVQSNFPERDFLQDDLAIAQDICRDDYGVPLSSWRPASE